MTHSLWNQMPGDRLLVDVSLWSADLTALGDEVRRLEPFADMVHIDVSDAHFAPGLLFFPDLIAALTRLTGTPFHVHLMVERPLDLLDAVLEAGADMVTVDYKNGDAVPEVIRRVRHHERAVGLAVGLDVEPEAVRPYLDRVELVLMMGTPLGIKGVDLAPSACHRIEVMRRLLREAGQHERVKIGADGGLRRQTVPALRAAGADLVAPGSLIFGAPDLDEVFSWLWSLPEPVG
ncbi:MAG: ribulose-phosphate 3-epimerase [Chloroflexota bacterium]